MFKPVPMTRVRLLILEHDERALLRHLGQADIVQLTHSPAGPETAPLPPRSLGNELARLDPISARLENLRRSLELPRIQVAPEAAVFSVDEAAQNLRIIEEQCGGLLKERRKIEQQLAELAAIDEKIADYRNIDLPMDEPDASSFLHFVTGSLPVQNFKQLQTSGNVALLPLAEKDGRQLLIAMTTRTGRPRLNRMLQQIGFEPEKLPVVPGTTSAELSERNRHEKKALLHDLHGLNAKLRAKGQEFRPILAQIEDSLVLERNLLQAEQQFPRTERAVLVTGWVPNIEIPALERYVREITHGCYVMESTPAEKISDAEVPVLLRHPRLLRPFALLVAAYGFPKYRELEPTLFVAVSYLLMFGMMFGDSGHGLVLAIGGMALLFGSRRAALRQAGLLLSFAGGSSIVSGIIYGSYFGLPQFKKYSLWHDPLAGNPASLMVAAIEIGIVMISLALVLNIINCLRHGKWMDAVLDRFGVAGAVFYWGALLLATKSAAIRANGFLAPAICLLLVLPVVAWLLKEPIEIWRHHDRKLAGQSGLFGVAVESFVNTFEGLLSYFANTVSFVRLAAYAMSHAALLMATFMIAENVKHLPLGGNLLGVMVIIFGNLVAIVLEGIVASVQALRLEYYEFFGKFFSGGGRPFEPFRLQTTPVAESPL